MRRFSNDNPSKVFAQLSSDVNDKFSDRVTQSDLENYSCEKNRDLDLTGKQSGRRKKDCIFYDISSNQIQNFYRVHKKQMKGPYMHKWKLQMYYHNKWKDIDNFCDQFFCVIQNPKKHIGEIVHERVTKHEIFPQNPFDIKL